MVSIGRYIDRLKILTVGIYARQCMAKQDRQAWKYFERHAK